MRRCIGMVMGGGLAAVALAGGGPYRTAVLVNENVPHSLEVGYYYARLRGIPDEHVVHLRTTNGINLDTAAFSNEIRNPLIAWLGSSERSNQIDAVVVAPGFPYRIYQPPYGDLRHGGLTAALFHDFKSSPSAFTAGCQIAPGSSNDYCATERAFSHADAPSSNRYWLTALLAGSNRLDVLRLVDRAAAADYTAPTSTVELLHTTDYFRNRQWPQFEGTDFDLRLLGGPCTGRIEDADWVAGRTNLLGYVAGNAYIYNLELNHLAPGAFGHHLTSFGGFLHDAASQMSALDWIHHGCAGTYGTVVEPCSFPEKFPRPQLHYWYARGFSLGEAAWMSLQHPYQGVLVGDPLCAPYALTGRVTVAGLTNGQALAGSLTVTVRVEAARADRPVADLDLYLDGRWLGAVTNVGPRPGNFVELVAGVATVRHVFAAGHTIFTATAALAGALATAGVPVRAQASGDRLLLVHTNPLVAGDDVACAVSVGAGTASALRVWGWRSAPTLTASTYPAREFLRLRGVAGAGDQVASVLTLTNGLAVTSRVTAAGGETAATLLPLWMDAVNSNALLQGTDGVRARYLVVNSASNVEAVLEARAPGPPGAALLVDYQVTRAVPGSGLVTTDSFVDRFNDNADVLVGRAHVVVAGGVTDLTAEVTLDTATWPDGPHELAWVAREGTGPASETWRRVPVWVANHSLTCEVVAPPAAHVVWTGAVVTARVESAGATQLVLHAGGQRWASGAGSPLVAAVTTAVFGAGPLALWAEAQHAAGVAVRSRPVTVQVASDDDGDGLSDQWEYQRFGHYEAAAGEDPDGDGSPNGEEYLADTVPTAATSALRVASLAVTSTVQLMFVTSSARWYRVEASAGDLRAAAAWSPLSTNLLPGDGGPQVVTDPAPSNRAYRVRAFLP